MKGAIVGDVVGSRFEGEDAEDILPGFSLFTAESKFTDDTVLTLAVAEHLLTGEDLVDLLKQYYARYPGAGYGWQFYSWARCGGREPYHSFGNGSAMRVAPVAWWYQTEDEVRHHAARTAAVTHDHPEGIKGAIAIALGTFWARRGHGKTYIRDALVRETGYNLTVPLANLPLVFRCDATCQESVPVAVTVFLAANSFEETLRLAVAAGGDTDTIACMAGALAEAHFSLPDNLWRRAESKLDKPLREVARSFLAKAPGYAR